MKISRVKFKTFSIRFIGLQISHQATICTFHENLPYNLFYRQTIVEELMSGQSKYSKAGELNQKQVHFIQHYINYSPLFEKTDASVRLTFAVKFDVQRLLLVIMRHRKAQTFN